jgi:hypothetical protein
MNTRPSTPPASSLVRAPDPVHALPPLAFTPMVHVARADVSVGEAVSAMDLLTGVNITVAGDIFAVIECDWLSICDARRTAEDRDVPVIEIDCIIVATAELLCRNPCVDESCGDGEPLAGCDCAKEDATWDAVSVQHTDALSVEDMLGDVDMLGVLDCRGDRLLKD